MVDLAEVVLYALHQAAERNGTELPLLTDAELGEAMAIQSDYGRHIELESVGNGMHRVVYR